MKIEIGMYVECFWSQFKSIWFKWLLQTKWDQEAVDYYFYSATDWCDQKEKKNHDEDGLFHVIGQVHFQWRLWTRPFVSITRDNLQHGWVISVSSLSFELILHLELYILLWLSCPWLNYKLVNFVKHTYSPSHNNINI